MCPLSQSFQTSTIFPIPSGVKSANTEAPLLQRSEKEERADQSETDIEYIDN